jgi:lysophospholipid acyltransferase (LPLAT)-like uncharacterized protein
MVTERAENLPNEPGESGDALPPAPAAAARPRVRRGSRSQRRLNWSRRLIYAIAVPIGIGLIHFFWATCRIVRVEGMAHVEKDLLGGKPAVICYWHRHQLLCWRFVTSLFPRGLRAGWLISASVDGEAISEVARRIGGGLVFRGSTTSRGAEALRSICKAVIRDGVSPVVTPDGPRGPRSMFKPGIVKIAQLSGAPLVPMAWCASHALVLKTWDRFVVPRPFCKVVMAVGEGVTVPRQLDEAGTAQIQARLERVLEELFQQARAALDRT